MAELRCWTDLYDWADLTGLVETTEWLALSWRYPCGATCLLPDGHQGPHQWTDDREIVVEIGPAAREAGLVRVEFGKPVAWLAMGAAEARAFADALRASADSLEGGAA